MFPEHFRRVLDGLFLRPPPVRADITAGFLPVSDPPPVVLPAQSKECEFLEQQQDFVS